MILLRRPDGGETWVHESRLEEYQARGFIFPAPPQKPEEPKKRKKKE
jgi:hypothetical protein